MCYDDGIPTVRHIIYHGMTFHHESSGAGFTANVAVLPDEQRGDEGQVGETQQMLQQRPREPQIHQGQRYKQGGRYF